jgi:type II secretory pathway pseudopilin PulG
MLTIGRSVAQPVGASARRGAFSLIELLLAMFIMALGLVAIASLFPVAGAIQKTTVDDVLGQQVARNVQAMVTAKPLVEGDQTREVVRALHNDFGWDFDTTRLVYPLSPFLGRPTPRMTRTWPLLDRGYPIIEPDPQKRMVYWVPLIQDADPARDQYSWRMPVFILRRAVDTNYDYVDFGNSRYTRRSSAPVWANQDDGKVRGEDYWTVPGVRRVAVRVDADRDTIVPDTLEFDENGFNDANGDNQIDQIVPGDWVLSGFGVPYRVMFADEDSFTVDGAVHTAERFFWYAPPHRPGARSPAVSIVIVPDGCVEAVE